jgi:hypothetical protein
MFSIPLVGVVVRPEMLELEVMQLMEQQVLMEVV